MRHKEGHGINIHPSLKFAIDFGFSLIPEKYKKRIQVIHFHIILIYIIKRRMNWCLLKYNYYKTGTCGALSCEVTRELHKNNEKV
jgi:hypothetical protein